MFKVSETIDIYYYISIECHDLLDWQVKRSIDTDMHNYMLRMYTRKMPLCKSASLVLQFISEYHFHKENTTVWKNYIT